MNAISEQAGHDRNIFLGGAPGPVEAETDEAPTMQSASTMLDGLLGLAGQP